MRGKGRQIVVQRDPDRFGFGSTDPGDQRRLFDDPPASLVLFGEAGQRPVAGSGSRPGGSLVDLGAQ